jgi:hypothetical protein
LLVIIGIKLYCKIFCSENSKSAELTNWYRILVSLISSFVFTLLILFTEYSNSKWLKNVSPNSLVIFGVIFIVAFKESEVVNVALTVFVGYSLYIKSPVKSNFSL